MPSSENIKKMTNMTSRISQLMEKWRQINVVIMSNDVTVAWNRSTDPWDKGLHVDSHENTTLPIWKNNLNISQEMKAKKKKTGGFVTNRIACAMTKRSTNTCHSKEFWEGQYDWTIGLGRRRELKLKISKGARSWKLLDITQELWTCSDNVNVSNMDTSCLLIFRWSKSTRRVRFQWSLLHSLHHSVRGSIVTFSLQMVFISFTKRKCLSPLLAREHVTE